MFRGRLVRGHNDMLGRVRGVDGIKTGYIRASGFNIVTSYNADGRKLIVVVMGADSARQRNDHVEALIQRSLSPTMADTKTRLMFAGDQPSRSRPACRRLVRRSLVCRHPVPTPSPEGQGAPATQRTEPRPAFRQRHHFGRLAAEHSRPRPRRPCRP